MSKPNTVTCPHCGREQDDDPGSYYHRKACQREKALYELREARARGASEAEIQALEDELASASYVGD